MGTLNERNSRDLTQAEVIEKRNPSLDIGPDTCDSELMLF